jgi:hypothetical protein
VREAFAELGVDQECIDAVFGGNAQHIKAMGRMDVRGGAFCRIFTVIFNVIT